MGSRKTNATIRDFGYNDNTIRNQKIFRPIQGANCTTETEVEISDEKLPCRKRKISQ